MRAVILILSLVLATTAAGQVYRSVDENGKVTYSDAPSSGAKKIHVAPIQTYVNPAVGQGAKKPTPAATAEKKKRGYLHPKRRGPSNAPGTDPA